MRHHQMKVDGDVWEALIERQAKLTVRVGRRVTINETVRDLLAEAWSEEALAPWPEAEEEPDTEEQP
jgi:hypothetical protein